LLLLATKSLEKAAVSTGAEGVQALRQFDRNLEDMNFQAVQIDSIHG
jgi:hypothetical protein